ncbi:MAG: hypothetical protein SGPRY_011273 [Prymnesium sp.]
METITDLKEMAPKLNPVVGYFNPLGLGEETMTGSGYSPEGVVGYLRHSEIKHGRVAMAAFVGFIVQSNGIHFPWSTTLSGVTYGDIAANAAPAAQWDALPTAAKLQILLFIGFLEFWGESSTALAAAGEKHYWMGGKPGFYPSFAPFREIFGHPVLDLFDPFGGSKKMSEERKERALLAEINNGRAAMIGIMGFMAAASVEGSVPALSGLIAHYDGECMAPFSATDTSLPMVSDMLNFPKLDSISKLFPYN